MICIDIEEYTEELKTVEQRGIERGYLHCLNLVKTVLNGELVEFSEGTTEDQKEIWLKFIDAIKCKCKDATTVDVAAEAVPIVGD
jgi:hypothetical protein